MRLDRIFTKKKNFKFQINNFSYIFYLMMSKTEKYMKKHDFNKNFKIITLKTTIYHISKKILRLG